MPPAPRMIAVIGSGSEPHAELARPLGRMIAREGHHLLCGGGGGVMAECAAAFGEVPGRAGLAIGILPAGPEGGVKRAPPGYPNPYIDLAIRTHLPKTGGEGKQPMSRNHLIVLSAFAVVALPGGAGTRSEIELALEYETPLILFAPGGEWRDFHGRAAEAKNAEDVLSWINSR